MKYLKYLALIGQIIGAIEAAKAGSVAQEIRGVRVGKDIWDLNVSATKRAKD